MPGGIEVPLELAAAWQTDAFPHGARAPPTLTFVSISFGVLTLVVVSARLYDRCVVRRNGGVDDILIAASMIPTLGLCVLMCLAEKLYGFDRHAWDVTVEKAPHARKVLLSISILYLVSSCLTKVSILYFYRRLGEIKKWFRLTIWVNIGFIISFTVAFSIGLFLECRPLYAYWNVVNPLWRMSHEYHCVDEGPKMLSACAISVFHDFVVCILPMTLFWDLHISRRAKLGLMLIFSLGFLTCACGIARMIKTYYIYYETYDSTWAARPAFAIIIIESCLSIICGSLPALKNSLQQCFHCLIHSFTLGSRRTNRWWKKPFHRSAHISFHDIYSLHDIEKATRRPAPGCSTAQNSLDEQPLRPHRQPSFKQGSSSDGLKPLGCVRPWTHQGGEVKSPRRLTLEGFMSN